MSAKGRETELLKRNVQSQLDRLVKQLAECEEFRYALDARQLLTTDARVAQLIKSPTHPACTAFIILAVGMPNVRRATVEGFAIGTPSPVHTRSREVLPFSLSPSQGCQVGAGGERV